MLSHWQSSLFSFLRRNSLSFPGFPPDPVSTKQPYQVRSRTDKHDIRGLSDIIDHSLLIAGREDPLPRSAIDDRDAQLGREGSQWKK